MVQGTPGAYALTARDLRPRARARRSSSTSEAYKRKTRPLLRWRPGLDLWGVQRFRVYIDGVLIGETTDDTLTPRVAARRAGKHTWQIEAVDRARPDEPQPRCGR